MIEKKGIEKITKEFLSKFSKEEDLKVAKIEGNVVFMELVTQTPEIFIGKHGLILGDLQHILARILRKKTGEEIFVDLDINQYKEKKTNYLKDLAQGLADEVSLTKKEKILPAMSPYERRIIHLALSERNDVKTESFGEEPERRIAIKPA